MQSIDISDLEQLKIIYSLGGVFDTLPNKVFERHPFQFLFSISPGVLLKVVVMGLDFFPSESKVAFCSSGILYLSDGR